MKTSTPSSFGRRGAALFQICLIFYCCGNCGAYLVHHSSGRKPSPNYSQPSSPRRRSYSLRISTIDVDIPRSDGNNYFDVIVGSSDTLLSWKDILPLSLYTTICALVAIVISTYEDFDVTHVRPSPSTLRLPTTISRVGEERHFDFLGAATRGMGWGPSNRGEDGNFFEEWYGTSALSLQGRPSYNEIMLQHRSERVPRWNQLEIGGNSAANTNVAAASKEQLQQAVLQLYKSLDDLDDLKALADDYNWEEMKERLNPTANTITAESKKMYSLQTALEYSMDVLKTTPSYYLSSTEKELPDLIGFDWGSCAWRHCGAKADAQEAIAELYSSVGMLEPFECRFIIDIVERSIRDVLTVIPDDLKPHENGVLVEVKSYEPYVSKSGNDGAEMGIDYEYTQALQMIKEWE